MKKLLALMWLLTSCSLNAAAVPDCMEVSNKFRDQVKDKYPLVGSDTSDPQTIIIEVRSEDQVKGRGIVFSTREGDLKQGLQDWAKSDEEGKCTAQGTEYQYLIYTFDRSVQADGSPSGDESSGS